METKMETRTEFVLEVEDLEPRTLPTAILPGARRGKLAAGGLAGTEFMCSDGVDLGPDGPPLLPPPSQ